MPLSLVRRRLPAAALCFAVAGTLAGCSTGGGPAKAPLTGGSPTATSSPAPEPRPTHPFTGGRAGLDNPVLAVKVDNSRAAHPQTGLTKADIVYVEQVEGGLTRLMAIYSSRLPRRVGPVRSARISDLHILAQFGSPAFAYSGVQSKMKPYVARSRVRDVSPERAGGAYARAGSKPAPYNMYAGPKTLLARAKKESRPRDIGFRFGAAPAGGKAVKRFSVRYPSASFTFRWSKKRERWLVWQDGRRDMAAEGGQLGGRTVVIQYAKTTRSRFHDFMGNYTPLVHTTGTGRAVVLRDGKAYQTKWSRSAERKGTTFTTSPGKRMTFAPGQVWVVLVKPGKPKIP